ncbi:SDR family oxidoreductase [Nocardioides plantarum]|uniref:SDR family oxidoreductase n=1 Tax=Nocardioides plantarum TaxID=29299 RepID=A0ABV5KFN7_9ACTN|nr:SDR family oxidoreductase [Nocardioides plantarum]
MSRTALVLGAHGVIGSTLIDHLAALPDFDVVGVSRRGGSDTDQVRHVAVDLLDADATYDAMSRLPEVTHVFYAAFQDRPTWAELVAPNLAMLTHTVEAVAAHAADLRHVSLMQGYKVYGAHLGPFQTPAREDDLGHLPPEFNLDQQRYLTERQAGQDWTWSALRPSVVCGTALGNPMSLVAVLAVYATISKELGVPLRFPGRPGAYDTLLEMTDAGLLARATVWAATDPAAANQAFNITNGDLFRWNQMWPFLAGVFGLPVGAPLPMTLADVMADKQELWERIVADHDLVPTPWADVSSWPFGDAVFSWDYDFLADGSKARRHGFNEHVDTRLMFADLVADLRQRRIIP